MKATALILLICAIAVRLMAADPEFDCILTSDQTTYPIGPAPEFVVRITNRTTHEVVLVSYLQGSDGSLRFPRCLLEIFDSAGKPVQDHTLRCGNMDYLKATDFVTVPPGASFKPFPKGLIPTFVPFQLHPIIKMPGDYTFRFHYITSEQLSDYLGDERMNEHPTIAPEIQRLFERVPKVDLKSNELKLKFAPKLEGAP